MRTKTKSANKTLPASPTAREQTLFGYVHIERNKIKETGECNLEGLFIRREV